MSFFSSPSFLGSAMDAFHRGEGWGLEDVESGGVVVRTAVRARGRALVDCPFLDYLVSRPYGRAPRRIPYAPRVVRGEVEVERWTPEGPGTDVAPFVAWGRFADWGSFVEHARARFGGAFRITERKRKKLARDHGAPRFVIRPEGDDVLAQVFAWKSEQYLRSGLVDLFASEQVRRLFRNLHERGALALPSLYCGDRLVACHLGVVHEGRFLSWVPAHDASLSSCSVGTILLEEVMRWSFEERHDHFDFLLGPEDYKLVYATHCARIAPIGAPPLPLRAWSAVRGSLIAPVRRHAALYDWLRASKRRWRQARLRSGA